MRRTLGRQERTGAVILEQTFDGGRKFVNNRRTCPRHIVQAALLEISKLTVEELRRNLLQLIETYMMHSGVRDELPSLVVRRDMAEISESDANIIDEIALYFCGVASSRSM